MIISGFEPKAKKEKKMDIECFVGGKYSRDIFQKIDTDGKYSSACDGFRLVITGNIENFQYQTFDDKDNPLLKLAHSVTPKINDLDYLYNKITVNVNELLEASNLFKKNMKITEKNIKTGKNESKVFPVVTEITNNKIQMEFLYKSEMKAEIDVVSELYNQKNKIRIGLNPKYIHDAMKLLRNRKVENITMFFTENNPEVNPIHMYTKDIYIMIFPVRLPTQEEKEEE